MLSVQCDHFIRYRESRDPQAFRELVRQYQDLVYGTCRRILGNTAEVEDAVQETFIKLAHRAGEIRISPGAWLHACARTTSLDALKANRVRSHRESSWRNEKRSQAGSSNASDAGDRAESASVIDECIAELGDSDRDLVLSYFFVNDSQTEIASRAGVTKMAINKRLDRVLEVLRRKMVIRGLAAPGLMAGFFAELTAQSRIPTSLAESLSTIDPSATVSAAISSSSPIAAAKAHLPAKVLLGILVSAAAVAPAAWWMVQSSHRAPLADTPAPAPKAVPEKGAQAMPAWRKAMAPFDVKSFDNSRFDQQPGAFGGTDADGWFAYSGGIVHQSSGALFVIGGGHSDSYRNEVWKFSLLQETPAWSKVAASTPLDKVGWAGNTHGTTHYLDNRPASRHTYWALSSDEANARIILHTASAVYGDGNGGGQNVDALDIAAGDYVAKDTYTPWPINPSYAAGFAIGYDNDIWLLAMNQHIYRWTPSKDNKGAPGVFADLGDKGVQTEYEVAHVVDPIRHLLFRIGGANINIPTCWFDLANGGAPHLVALEGDAAAIADLRGNRHTLVYDEGLDCLWAWRRLTATPALYKITVADVGGKRTFTVSPLQALAGEITNAWDFISCGYGRFAYVRALRGLVWCERPDRPVRFIATSKFDDAKK